MSGRRHPGVLTAASLLSLVLVTAFPGQLVAQGAGKTCPREAKTAFTPKDLESCLLIGGHPLLKAYGDELKGVARRSGTLYSQAIADTGLASTKVASKEEIQRFREKLAARWSGALLSLQPQLLGGVDALRIRVQDSLDAKDERSGIVAEALRSQRSKLLARLTEATNPEGLAGIVADLEPRKAGAEAAAEKALRHATTALEAVAYEEWARTTQQSVSVFAAAPAPDGEEKPDGEKPPGTAKPAEPAAPKPAANATPPPADLITALAESSARLQKSLDDGLQGVLATSDTVLQEVREQNKPAAATRTEDEKKAFRVALGAAWKEALDGAVKTFGAAFDKERLALGDKFRGQQGSANQLEPTLSAEQVRIVAALGEAVKSGSADQASSYEPEPEAAAKTDAAARLKKINEKVSATFKAEWPASRSKLGDSFGLKSANEVTAELQSLLQKQRDQEELDYYNELFKSTGFSRVVRCVWGGDPVGIVCRPGILVSAAESSEIEISNLPTDKEVTVTTYTSDELVPSIEAKPELWGEIEANSTNLASTRQKRDEVLAELARASTQKEKKLLQDEVNRLEARISNAEEYGRKLEARNRLNLNWEPFYGRNDTATCPGAAVENPFQRLSCDRATFKPGMMDRATIAIFKGRWIAPLYGGAFFSADRAFRFLRWQGRDTQERKNMSLLVSGDSPQIIVRVQVKGATEADTIVKSASIPIGYEKWSVETGGFIGLSTVTDSELVSTTGSNGKVTVQKIRDADRFAQDTGIFLNFVPRNYPYLGWGLGFSTAQSRPISMFLGPTLRLRSFGQRGLANIGAGVVLRSVKRFPDLKLNEPYDANDALLNGKTETRAGAYILIQLGFSFGPIPGPSDSTKTGGLGN